MLNPYTSDLENDVILNDQSVQAEAICLKENCKCRVRNRELYCSAQCKGGMSDVLHICDCNHAGCFHGAA
jgi:hypothetical protein